MRIRHADYSAALQRQKAVGNIIAGFVSVLIHYCVFLRRSCERKLSAWRTKSTTQPQKSHRIPLPKPLSFLRRQKPKRYLRWRKHVTRGCPTSTNNWISLKKHKSLPSIIYARFGGNKTSSLMLVTERLWQEIKGEIMARDLWKLLKLNPVEKCD